MKKKSDVDRLESGFQIKNLVLLESHFKRIPNVKFESASDKRIQVAVNVQVKENTISVTEKVEYTQLLNQMEEVSCTIVMAGIFEKVGNSKIVNLEEFGRINGAAIIFPYIREHLSNLSAKAGLGVIMLAPINFTNLAKQK